MRGALRPAVAVLLLVGVGLSMTARAARVCPLSRCCAAADVADDATSVDVDVTVPPALVLPERREGAPVAIAELAPRAPVLASHVLADAPKQSPPA